MQTQRKPGGAKRAPRSSAPRAEYLAAVRHLDGRREFFRVRDALDAAEARDMVSAEVGPVRAILIRLDC